ncbi:MAG: DUF1700 domain-containing protein [Lachnospiraceae bacterium]|nr:DUF1700 domain-containing protein [Lachnospiraceae bacterium]
MNRKEFLRQLEELLYDVQESERREAMEYYENYFDDAGPENEAKIIEELGSPRKVADSIKKDLFGENYNAYHEQSTQKQQSYENHQAFENQQKENKTQRNILIAVIVVLTFPIWIGLVGGLFGIIVGLIGGLFGIVIGVMACVLAAIVVGFVMAGIGLVKTFTGFPATGLIVIALGLFMLAVGILGLLLIVWCIGRFIPWFIRGIVMLIRKVFIRRGASI